MIKHFSGDLCKSGWYRSSPDKTIENSNLFLLIRCLAAEKYINILHLLIFFAMLTADYAN